MTKHDTRYINILEGVCCTEYQTGAWIEGEYRQGERKALKQYCILNGLTYHVTAMNE